MSFTPPTPNQVQRAFFHHPYGMAGLRFAPDFSGNVANAKRRLSTCVNVSFLAYSRYIFAGNIFAVNNSAT